MARSGLAALAVLAILVGVAGCGEDEGVAEGATVTAYVERPLCERATKQEGEVETVDGSSLKLDVICLADPRGPRLGQGVGGRRVDLLAASANARRATEDSSTIAYLEVDDPGVNRFTHPILETAGIGWLTATTRAEPMERLMAILVNADPDSLRADVREALGQS